MGLLLTTVFAMAVATRLYTIRLMKINGPSKFDGSCNYLLEEEVNEVESNSLEGNQRISLNNMKKTIGELKRVEESRLLRQQQQSDTGELKRILQKKVNTTTHKFKHAKTMVFPKKIIPSNNDKSKHLQNGRPEDDNEKSSVPHARRTIVRKFSTKVDSLLNAMNRKTSHDKQGSLTTKIRVIFVSYNGILSGLFLWNSQSLYFNCRDICNLFLCLFYAFYSTTIIQVSILTHSPWSWNVIFSLGLIGTSLMYLNIMNCKFVLTSSYDLIGILFTQAYVIRGSSIINAVATFNTDVVGKVLEEQEAAAEVEKVIREKILRKVTAAIGAQEGTNLSSLKVRVISDLCCVIIY